MLLEEQKDKDISIKRNSGLIITLRQEIGNSEKQLIHLLKRFKEKKLSEDKYLQIIRSNNSKWVTQLSSNEIKNLLFVIAEVTKLNLTNLHFIT
jgi:hypothetical protein